VKNIDIFVSTPEGRELFCDIMVEGGMWGELYAPDAGDVKYLTGRRSLALKLWNEVLQKHPESISVILDERLRREREEQSKLQNEVEKDEYRDPFE
jgi:hypothetical protein